MIFESHSSLLAHEISPNKSQNTLENSLLRRRMYARVKIHTYLHYSNKWMYVYMNDMMDEHTLIQINTKDINL